MKKTKHHTVGTVPNYNDKMKKTKHHTVGTVPNYNRKRVERGKFDTTTHIYITTYFKRLIQALQLKKKVTVLH